MIEKENVISDWLNSVSNKKYKVEKIEQDVYRVVNEEYEECILDLKKEISIRNFTFWITNLNTFKINNVVFNEMNRRYFKDDAEIKRYCQILNSGASAIGTYYGPTDTFPVNEHSLWTDLLDSTLNAWEFHLKEKSLVKELPSDLVLNLVQSQTIENLEECIFSNIRNRRDEGYNNYTHLFENIATLDYLHNLNQICRRFRVAGYRVELKETFVRFTWC